MNLSTIQEIFCSTPELSKTCLWLQAKRAFGSRHTERPLCGEGGPFKRIKFGANAEAENMLSRILLRSSSKSSAALIWILLGLAILLDYNELSEAKGVRVGGGGFRECHRVEFANNFRQIIYGILQVEAALEVAFLGNEMTDLNGIDIILLI